MRYGKTKKLLSIFLVLILSISTVGFAADIPTNFLVVGGTLVDLSYAMGNQEAFNQILTEFLQQGNSIEQLFLSLNGQMSDIYGQNVSQEDQRQIMQGSNMIVNGDFPQGDWWNHYVDGSLEIVSDDSFVELGQMILVRVCDGDLNQNGEEKEVATVQCFFSQNQFMLEETEPDSGIFEGMIPVNEEGTDVLVADNFQYAKVRYFENQNYDENVMIHTAQILAVEDGQTFSQVFGRLNIGQATKEDFEYIQIAGITEENTEQVNQELNRVRQEWDRELSLPEIKMVVQEFLGTLPQGLITEIIIQTSGDANQVQYGDTLSCTAEVYPEDALNTQVEWSVIGDTGEATIDQNGILTPVNLGLVTVRATAMDGSFVTAERIIEITGTDVNLYMGPDILSFNPYHLIVMVTNGDGEAVTTLQKEDFILRNFDGVDFPITEMIHDEAGDCPGKYTLYPGEADKYCPEFKENVRIPAGLYRLMFQKQGYYPKRIGFVLEGPDSTAVWAETDKYRESVLIPGTVMVGTDVTSRIAELLPGQTADESITLDFEVIEGQQFLQVQEGKVILTAGNDMEQDMHGKVRILFHKNEKDADKEVSITLQAQANQNSGTVEQSQIKETGGSKLQVNRSGDQIVIGGEIAFYEATEENKIPISGNWFGLKFTAPNGIYPDETAMLYINGANCNINGEQGWQNIREEGDGENFFHLFIRAWDISIAKEVTIKWNESCTQSYTITFAPNVVLQ